MVIKLKKPSKPDTGFVDDHSAEMQARRDETFRTKVAVQQFLNHNGPLFRAYAKAGTAISEVIDGDVLRVHASNAMRLAVLIASEIEGKSPEDISAAEAKPFRAEAAEYVSSRWLRNKPVDVDKAAHEMAAAIKLADKTFDHDAFKDDKISDDASLMISSIAVAGSLSRMVDIYDFRLGKENAFGQIVNVLVQTASKMSVDVLPGAVSEADRRNLTQTLARNLCALMEACYERKAIEVAEYLENSKLNDNQKHDWLVANAPVNDVLNSFKEWATVFGAFALAASQGLKNQNSPNKDGVKPA